MKAYSRLKELSKKAQTLSSIARLLHWDQETKMPKEAFLFRSTQLELISSLIHKEKTSPRFKKALCELIDLESGKVKVKGLSFVQKRALHIWRRDFLRDMRLPNAFVKKFAQITSQSMSIWAQAKKENNFSLFAPYLETIVGLCQEKIGYLGFDDHPYDALLDEYDPGRKTRAINTLFSQIGLFLPPLLEKVSKESVFDTFLIGSFDQAKIIQFSKNLLKQIGYNFDRGRLDLSNHPFSSTIHPYDSRITTRCFPHSYMETISATLHEAGHSFYEMGMPIEEFGTPLCEAVSLSIHESQSRFWETYIGQSQSFWAYFLPQLKATLDKSLENVSLPSFYRSINKVTKTPIRVDADEISYSLHVIVRFELEKSLITSSLHVKDLPEAWNFLMKKFLKITPQNDAEGCLQDVHWSTGDFGYFPTYVLGNLYASSFFNAFTKQYPDYETRIASGEFAFIKEYLHKHIYQYGRVYSGDELLKKISGETLSTEPYFSYLKEKYATI